MKKYDKIIDYIIDQSDRYDIRNLQTEEDIQFLLKKKKDILDTSILSYVRPILTLLDLTMFMESVTKAFTRYYNSIAMIYDKSISNHYDNGYKQTDDLIQIGREVEGKLSENVKEMQYGQYDENTIEFIKNHAMEQAKGYSDSKINQIRSTISDLMLKGKANKATVRDAVQKILDSNASKAEDIARTELSRAYNYGVLYRLGEFKEQNPNQSVQKYWHGFAYSPETCTYCRPRIGKVYDIDDESETLPAHVRCRCVWLPVMGGWDKPVSRNLTARANMLNTAYSEEMIYDRINNRLGINYANYLSQEAATDYMAGDRSEKVMNAIAVARENAIKDRKAEINIKSDTDGGLMSNRFNNQMSFWKDVVATAIIDSDKDTLGKSYDAIKAVMLLPWNGSQLGKWNDLLDYITRNR
jgi:SPP1 gp7 family putative phage head morphogenesis protein